MHEKIHQQLERLLQSDNKKAVMAAKESIQALYDLHIKKAGKNHNSKEKSPLKTCQ